MAAANDLGEFLRARRASLGLDDVGISRSFGPRRVPGLRREEVAHLAAISTDYYTRLEQGRIRPSPPILAAIARALRLTDDQHAYLVELAATSARRRSVIRDDVPRSFAQRDTLQAIIDDLQTSPAFVIGPRTEIVLWNQMGAALITDFGAIAAQDRYYIRLLITDPRMRHLYADWADVTRLAVEQLRRLNATHPDDTQLVALVRELTSVDADFRRWWESHDVAPRTSGTKLIRHPRVGDLHLDWSALTWNAESDLQIIAWTPANAVSRQRLTHLRDLAHTP